MEYEVKVIPDQTIAVINYKGPIEDLEILVSKLMGWAEAEELEVLSDPFVVYYSQRYEVNEGDAVFDVGIVLGEEADEKDIIRVVDMVEHKVLSGIHEGATDNIMESYAELVEIAEANNYDIIGSPKEVFVKSVFNHDNEDEYITEIQLPIIEM
ncbi:GyrI-like domain-containing protein [Methanobrevibacter millerae]|uniref:Effector-binding domain-containing protein n=1 Tax=Methanobrevibacter millerae TaxID=230361 RepID=A0A1G5VC21_9EURY|nr:GyrI-like domain-containing protein [Methanobrevibacter millerae]SDA43334.1 effector-binding domain-containing protein [Methanobrevibacter millerae]